MSALEIIRHRRNTRVELRETPREYGIEVDIRSRDDRLIVHHDPFTDGEDFADWLEDYRHGTLILNVKEEGLEARLISLMQMRKIDRFFFLDQSFPFLVKTAKAGERRCAVRISEFESIETALALRGLIDWIWVDCFTRFPLDIHDAARLHAADFRLCLVSPELQGRLAESEVADMRRRLSDLGIRANAVCTKRPELWAA